MAKHVKQDTIDVGLEGRTNDQGICFVHLLDCGGFRCSAGIFHCFDVASRCIVRIAVSKICRENLFNGNAERIARPIIYDARSFGNEGKAACDGS